jgi:hypothetical protein
MMDINEKRVEHKTHDSLFFPRPEIEITYPVLDMSMLTFTLQTRFYIYANLISFKYLTINMQYKFQRCKNKHNRGLSKLLELINPLFRQTFLF